MLESVTGSWVGYKQNDWYRVDTKTARPLFYEAANGLVAVPGVRKATEAFAELKAGRESTVIVHRTHLPLLSSPEALKLLTSVESSDWAARNRWAQARGFTPRVTQHQGIDFIAAHRGVLLGDDMRLGKGHPVGTKILAPNGWKRIEHLGVGDEVIGSNGRPCKIKGLYDRGVLPVFRVSFSDKTSVYVDSDHLWQVWNHNAWHRGGPSCVLSTQELAKDLSYSNGNRKWRIPLVEPVQFPSKKLPIDPYLLGVLLGDGSICHGTVSFTPGDELIPAAVRDLVPADVELRSSSSDNKAMCWRISARDGRHNSVLDALRVLGLQGKKSPEKFVPESYLFASVEQRLALLQGLMDTDGEWSNDVLGFSSSSKQLTDAVKFIVESLGGVARANIKREPKYTHNGEVRVGLPSYRLVIAMPAVFSPFRARIGYTPRSKFPPSRQIASIEAAGQAPVFCISVDAPDQLYVTENCIVTHNTLTCLMSHDHDRGPLVICAPLSTRGVWLGWIRRLWPDIPVGILTGKKKLQRELLERPIIFCHYDILRHWQSARRLGTIVFDEAHALTNRTSERSKAAVLFSSRAEKVIAATGTPIWSMPPDLWNILGILAPAAWGNYWDFGMRYGAPVHNGYGIEFTGVTNEAELTERLKEVKIRRLWREVRDDLPPISRSIVVADIDETTSRKLDILAVKLKKERTNTAANLALYRSQLCKVKLRTVIASATKALDAGEPIVVWTWHKEFADAIHGQFLDRSLLIHGDIKADERERRIEQWRQSPKPLALVATMAVAQVGIDLSHARLALFGELDYTPAIVAQAEMRTYSPDRPMDVTFVIANHVVDQRIVRALVSKLNAADPLGFGAATDAIDALREALEGPAEDPDMERFLDDVLAAGFEVS